MFSPNNHTFVSEDDINRFFQKSNPKPSPQWINICNEFVAHKKTWNELNSIVNQHSSLGGAHTDTAAALIRFMENESKTNRSFTEPLACVICYKTAPEEIKTTSYVRFKNPTLPLVRWVCDTCLVDEYRNQ